MSPYLSLGLLFVSALAVVAVTDDLSVLENTMRSLSRQTMLLQLANEERLRAEGYSGIKQVRNNYDGTRPYFGATHAGDSIADIHDHPNYINTVGMGQFEAVLNGVQFRTRHNDYKLKMPDPHNMTYNKMVDIPFPEVPADILKAHNVSDQLKLMKLYFKAFYRQDASIKNYQSYFKPVMCYLEGGWTTDVNHFSEPFESDTYSVDASTWEQLQEKNMFAAYTGDGTKSDELPYLPKTIINVTEDGTPVYAHWNYRIACHPIKTTLRLQNFRLINDLSTQLSHRKNRVQFSRDYGARFSISPTENNAFSYLEEGYGSWSERSYIYSLLDSIMHEIPGKDNYPAHILDNSFNMSHYDIHYRNNTDLNTGYYHRWFKVSQPGAMGLTIRHRGYSDESLFTAHTTNPMIAELSVTDSQYNPKTHKTEHFIYKKRVTYAIPLEVIWMTPLQSWNPYNLAFHGSDPHDIVTGGGQRNGGLTRETAFNGTNSKHFFLTPAELFSDDVSSELVGVLDTSGQVRKMVASGIRTILPLIADANRIRTRYPVMPIHVEGSPIYKELEALKDILMDTLANVKMFEHPGHIDINFNHAPETLFHMSNSDGHTGKLRRHIHDIYLTPEEINLLKNGNHTVEAFSTEVEGHMHHLDVHYDKSHDKYIIDSCDGKSHCWDGHGTELFKVH
ncbi:hypothetical protein CHS0354_025652 [Potamilus streckersoni]|uniref:Uncharacterized protein n=1 Tax=Potamilus streckersoni TaxID=2493646 RepID=A0AAE0VLI8_9BIVA|nr:hypothetical protein CHS0354_025652 [Potamilus streckersoni]